MNTIEISNLQQSAVLYLYTMQEEIQIDPRYQRPGDVWSASRRQLLVDSILNRFDIPKIYLHKLDGNALGNKKFAIIDGKQRLKAIWDFIDGEFALSEDIVFLDDPELELKGLTYAELGKRFPRIKQKFDSTSLSVVLVETTDEELIEEMFTRLNEAATLTAAEKRNAFGGPIPPIIRTLASHEFFTSRLPFHNTRYRHFDLVCKFLLLTDSMTITDTKKIHLDALVKGYKAEQTSTGEPEKLVEKIAALERRVASVLDAMSAKFTKEDDLLGSVGLVVVYYCLHVFAPEASAGFERSVVHRFERMRAENRAVAQGENDGGQISWTLLEFDRLMQAPNDSSAIRFKLDLLKKYLQAGSPNTLALTVKALSEQQEVGAK